MLCIERVTDCDCPICGDYMFTSPKAVCFMKCGHSIHRGCLDDYMQTSYKCPICNKSVTNMEFQFRNLDMAIQAQPMPPEFEDTRAVVLCNDCSAKSSVKYHWLGLKCAVCLSYNTAQLQILGTTPEADQAPVSEISAQLLEAAITTASRVPVQPEIPSGRDIPRRRRHSSNVLRPTATPAGEPDLGPHVSDRLSRSFAPMPIFSHAWNHAMAETHVDIIEEEEREDIIGFWSRLQRSIGSDEDGGDDDAAGSEDGSDWSTEDEEVEDDDDEDEDEDLKDFSLLGRKYIPVYKQTSLIRVLYV
ncbi:hypothetical protein SLS62_001625 [Diatrype stigma]|uniref:RING-type domain-containing protein n=1 Tax=Diatrype stigma TaxID=117547 RepID=A0AAN9UVL9_9PEZI